MFEQKIFTMQHTIRFCWNESITGWDKNYLFAYLLHYWRGFLPYFFISSNEILYMGQGTINRLHVFLFFFSINFTVDIRCTGIINIENLLSQN